MAHVSEMLDNHPQPSELARQKLIAAIEALTDCAQTCSACADACVGEDMVDGLRRCIRLDLDCADVCATTSRVLTRQTELDFTLTRSVLEACVQACRTCAEECEMHAEMHAHCRICAEACRACQQACEELLQSMPAMAAAG
jgi:hypothetical protein